MKKLIPLLLLLPLPAFAGPVFKYQTSCYLENKGMYLQDTCTVVETREKGGQLKTRNVYSNRFGLTIKLRWNGQQFVTWDSHNKYDYSYPYQVVEGRGSMIMPGVIIEQISWD